MVCIDSSHYHASEDLRSLGCGMCRSWQVLNPFEFRFFDLSPNACAMTRSFPADALEGPKRTPFEALTGTFAEASLVPITAASLNRIKALYTTKASQAESSQMISH